MSSAASRLVAFNNNAFFQNLIQRHLLRPSAVADGSVTQLLNKVKEPQVSSHVSSKNAMPYLNTLQPNSFDASEATKKKYSSDRDVSMIMFGLSGINQSENLKIHVRRYANTDDDNDVDSDDDDDNYVDSDTDSD